MSRQLLYLFGEPGTGKITVARLLQKELGWRLFWLHDLDSVCAIVGRYPVPRLMDRISLAVLEELMEVGEDIIYVRPSRDAETVFTVLDLASYYGYKSFPVRLTASKETLAARVSVREKSPFRVSSPEALKRYIDGRPATSVYVDADNVSTENRCPEEVVALIRRDILFKEKLYANGGRECGTRQQASAEAVRGPS